MQLSLIICWRKRCCGELSSPMRSESIPARRGWLSPVPVSIPGRRTRGFAWLRSQPGTRQGKGSILCWGRRYRARHHFIQDHLGCPSAFIQGTRCCSAGSYQHRFGEQVHAATFCGRVENRKNFLAPMSCPDCLLYQQESAGIKTSNFVFTSGRSGVNGFNGFCRLGAEDSESPSVR
jgi:hypothetical protein